MLTSFSTNQNPLSSITITTATAITVNSTQYDRTDDAQTEIEANSPNLNEASLFRIQNNSDNSREIRVSSYPYPPTMTLAVDPYYLPDIVVYHHYTFRIDLNRTIYKVMMYGDEKRRILLKKAILRTFIYRYLILLPLIITDVIGSIFTFKEFGYFVSYCIPIAVFLLVVLIKLTIVLIHHMRSTRDKQTYMLLNKTRVEIYQDDEVLQAELRSHALNSRPNPPNYQEASSVPPAYRVD